MSVIVDDSSDSGSVPGAVAATPPGARTVVTISTMMPPGPAIRNWWRIPLCHRWSMIVNASLTPEREEPADGPPLGLFLRLFPRLKRAKLAVGPGRRALRSSQRSGPRAPCEECRKGQQHESNPGQARSSDHYSVPGVARAAAGVGDRLAAVVGDAITSDFSPHSGHQPIATP
jgi:hypothetical protein